MLSAVCFNFNEYLCYKNIAKHYPGFTCCFTTTKLQTKVQTYRKRAIDIKMTSISELKTTYNKNISTLPSTNHLYNTNYLR